MHSLRLNFIKIVGAFFLFAFLLYLPAQVVLSHPPVINLPSAGDDITGTEVADNVIGIQEKLSSMGPTNDASFDAYAPAVAYNSQDHTFLVVWSGADSTAGEYEIWGQRVDADSMVQLGFEF